MSESQLTGARAVRAGYDKPMRIVNEGLTMHAITDVIKRAGAVAHIGKDRVPNEICRAALLPADVIRDTS